MHEQKQPPEVFYKKGVFRNFSKFTPVPGSQIPQNARNNFVENCISVKQ